MYTKLKFFLKNKKIKDKIKFVSQDYINLLKREKLIFEANYGKVAAPMFCVRLLEY